MSEMNQEPDFEVPNQEEDNPQLQESINLDSFNNIIVLLCMLMVEAEDNGGADETDESTDDGELDCEEAVRVQKIGKRGPSGETVNGVMPFSNENTILDNNIATLEGDTATLKDNTASDEGNEDCFLPVKIDLMTIQMIGLINGMIKFR
ncbi:Uncharacterized protein TCM_026064 [Theobroma cacao]|uniref:Uncharacterized protein n=1 Tax=Theobroma cacao TaxID=3641 RepID=A0A061F151_THECC|nr:Uncharacterized protein TCM_026064 [Theobroma cacao]